ncbi:type II secretion system protein N [Xylophilus sp. Kf1]|nr:type II secretion system protein N [Xylophilus sp. Kf1]
MARRSAHIRSEIPRAARRRTPITAAALLGALLGAVVALVLFAPARWLAQTAASASQGHLLLTDARGTVWNGSAQLVLAGGSGSTDAAALPDRVEWRLRPALTGLRLQLGAACCTPQPLVVHADVRFDGIHLRVDDGRSSWPAALLSGLGTPFNTLQPEGTLALGTSALTLHLAAGRLSVAGRADFDLRDMASSLSPLRPLGSYRLSVQGGAVPGLDLRTLDGPLQLSGTGQWVGNRLRFVGEARALPEREAALSVLLNLLGRRVGATSVITLG